MTHFNSFDLRRALLAAAFAVGATACGNKPTDPDGIICDASAAAAINLTIVDSLSGNQPPFTGLFARAVDGTYRDSTVFFYTHPTTGAVTGGLAYEHAGTMTVTVRAFGYQEWNKSGVVVTKGVCHVNAVQLTARLVK